MNSKHERADFEKQMATLLSLIEEADQATLIEALLSACGEIVSLLTQKKTSGTTLEFLAAQLAHSFVTDCRGAGVKRRVLEEIDTSRATIN